ncbi:tyrosine-type recombinase/integrase [Streptomyces albidoflavus]|uniref:tyrosine-type recombinase/integrase n=1 Tax=Streptomyces albidoflavus TaxID=1886 RepID=UPI003410A68A
MPLMPSTDLEVVATGALSSVEQVSYVREVCEEIERQWLLELKNPHTKRAYRRNVDNWFDWCLDNSVSPLAAQRQHSAQWSADLHEVLSPSSTNQSLSAMNSWYTFGLDEYEKAFQIARTPWRKKHRIDVSDESQTLGLDRSEALALRQVSWEYGAFDAAVIEVLLGMGLRSAELENAKISSYGRARGIPTLTVVRKRTKTQILAVPPGPARAIDLHLASRPQAHPDEPLLLCPDGKPLTNRRLDVIVKRCCRAAHLGKEISPHGLRHTCATLMLDADVSLRKVQRILGHADPRTTNRYDLARYDLDASPVFALADFLAAA